MTINTSKERPEPYVGMRLLTVASQRTFSSSNPFINVGEILTIESVDFGHIVYCSGVTAYDIDWNCFEYLPA